MNRLNIKAVAVVVAAVVVLFSAPLPLAAQDSGIEAFVTRFYNLCLDRQPDSTGLDNWVSHLQQGTLTGADVAQRFIFSDEFLAKNTTDAQYLEILYAAFFNRPPDMEGYAGWLGQLQSGRGRQFVLTGFINSVEFAQLCLQYGIEAGSAGSISQTDAGRIAVSISGSESFKATIGQVTGILKTGYPPAYSQLALVSRIVERDLSGYSASAMADIDKMIIYIDLNSFSGFGDDKNLIIAATLSHELNHLANRDLADSMGIADYERLALQQELETCYGIGAPAWYISYLKNALEHIYDSSTWWWNRNDIAA